MSASLNLTWIGLGAMGCYVYLFLLTRSVVKYIKSRHKAYLVQAICLNGLPLVVFAFIFTKNSSLMSLISLTLGVSLGLIIFLGFVFKKWSI